MGGLAAGRKKQHGALRASTLVEVLVASIIFLVVFIVSLETSVRITAAQPIKAHTYILIQSDLHGVRMKYEEREYAKGEYTEQFIWGEVLVKISDHEPYEGMLRLDTEAKINGTPSRLHYTYILETGL